MRIDFNPKLNRWECTQPRVGLAPEVVYTLAPNDPVISEKTQRAAAALVEEKPRCIYCGAEILDEVNAPYCSKTCIINAEVDR